MVVNDRIYLVDCGSGAGDRLRQAELVAVPPTGEYQRMLARLRAVFLTHLHSDHIVDYFGLLMFGWFSGLPYADRPVQVYGPGSRGELPPVFGPPGTPAPPIINPAAPVPGTVAMTKALYAAYASDLNDRMRDSGRPDLRRHVHVHDIALPPGLVVDPDHDPAPAMRPITVYEDENVKVSATLVLHRPTFPAFAYRFDTDDGSVVFSGDCRPR